MVFEGGTHNPFAPPVDFIARCFLPVLRTMGVSVEVALERHGFYPAGGGRFRVDIEPCSELSPIELLDGGKVVGRRAVAIVAGLPASIAEREIRGVRKRLGWAASECEARVIDDSRGPGNVIMLEVERKQVAELATGFGERGVRAESVAQRVVNEIEGYLVADVPVGRHLADQLILPLALQNQSIFPKEELVQQVYPVMRQGHFISRGQVQLQLMKNSPWMTIPLVFFILLAVGLEFVPRSFRR